MSDESVILRHEGPEGVAKWAREEKERARLEQERREAQAKSEREEYARDLAANLATLKAAGVKSFNGMLGLTPFTVEFFPPQPAAVALEKLPAATGEEKCDCGCALSDHEAGGGTCLHGCPAEKCGLPEEKP